MKFSGWGRFPVHEAEPLWPFTGRDVLALQSGATGLIARGNGRAYGDAAIGTRQTLLTGRLARMMAFDPGSGLLTVEAGTLLTDIIETFLPRGYFPLVVPGTRYVSVGGMLASDVHGKNHHLVGGFGDTVESFTLALPDGRVVRCSRSENADLFHATQGGMGLTGTVLDATFRLVPVETGWITQHTLVAANLGEAIRLLGTDSPLPYSVAWIDCLARGTSLGRSLVYRGEHASLARLADLGRAAQPWPALRRSRLSVPFDAPGVALNRHAVAAFNEIYYRSGAAQAAAPRLVPWHSYFFPLDHVLHWNRLYGRRGFVQHQCVIPSSAAESTLHDILDRIARRGSASFLAVLKKLGPGSGWLSFPADGYTLALDLKFEPDLLAFLDEIDERVVAAGGRLYLAKDARQSRATFEAGYPAVERFRGLRRALGATGRIESFQSRRLGL